MQQKIVTIMASLMLATLIVAPLHARTVIVNGQYMNDAQLLYLDMVSCSTVPDGNYWVDNRTGQWGYVGSGSQGYVGQNCGRQQRRPSLSERQMLYSPGELLR